MPLCEATIIPLCIFEIKHYLVPNKLDAIYLRYGKHHLLIKFLCNDDSLMFSAFSSIFMDAM